MQQAKLLGTLAGALLILAVAAIPASAWFSARTSNARQGTFVSGGAGVFTPPSGSVFICSKMAGAWHIESSGKVLEQSKGPGQQLTKEGPHLGLTISKWGGPNGCSASWGLTITRTPCILQVEQPAKGVNTGTASIAQSCKVKIILNAEGAACEYEEPVTGNERLPKTTFTEVGTNVEIKSETSGITTTVVAGKEAQCTALGITANSENKFKAITIAEGVKLV